MEHSFWSDSMPPEDYAKRVNKYFAGSKFNHKQLGHAVIEGYRKYVDGENNMFFITTERSTEVILVTFDEFYSHEMQRQIDVMNRLKFVQFAIQSLFDIGKCYKRDCDVYTRAMEYLEEDNVASSTNNQSLPPSSKLVLNQGPIRVKR